MSQMTCGIGYNYSTYSRHSTWMDEQFLRRVGMVCTGVYCNVSPPSLAAPYKPALY